MINKTSFLRNALWAGFLATFIIPIIVFIFFTPYYDRSEQYFYPPGYSRNIVFQKDNVRLIRQPIFSTGKNLAKITIQARLPRKNTTFSLADSEGNIIRSETKPRAANNAIIWKFNPIEDSSHQIYYLTIEIPDDVQKNIRLELLPTAQKEYFVQINNEAIDGKALSFFTESKFASPQEKIQMLHQRSMTYKPIFIKLLFFPALLVFSILLIMGFANIISSAYFQNNKS